MSQLPAWAAGSKITAAELLEMAPQVVWKLSDTSRQSTTTLANDPDLQILLQPGTYIIDGWLYYVGAAIGTGDLKITFASSASFSPGLFSAISPNTSSASAANFGVVSFGTAYAMGTTVNPTYARITGFVTVGTAATLALEWAQNTSNATATVVKAGSWLLTKQIA